MLVVDAHLDLAMSALLPRATMRSSLKATPTTPATIATRRTLVCRSCIDQWGMY